MKLFFEKNYFYAGFLFLGLALYEVWKHSEIELALYLALAVSAGSLFSHALCLRHNHNHFRRIIFIPLVVVSNAFHVCVDATLLLSNLTLYGLGAMLATFSIMLPHEILRQPAHIKTLRHEGVSLYHSLFLITGVYILVTAFIFLTGITEVPELLHDASILTYGFLAGEILWHERKNFLPFY